MKKTTLFKKYILDPKILLMPCAHDVLTAKIAAQTGFKAVCAGGYGASASLLGKPDIGLLTLTEMADHLSRMVDGVDIPVFADGDTGHGNTSNVARTVKCFERAGAAGLFIEDQVSPKRCGHMDGKQIISQQEMIAKLKAALDARSDPNLVIMARTDALAIHGLDEALERADLFRETGADLIFVEAPRTLEEMKQINEQIKAPTLAVYLEGGKTPLLSANALEAIGFNAVAFAATALFAAAYAVREVFQEILETGEARQVTDRIIAFEELNDLLGLSAIREREENYYSIRTT